MKRLSMISLLMIGIILLFGCMNDNQNLNIQKVGMILEGNIKDHSWDQLGYKGLTAISDTFDVSVNYKENIQTKEKTLETVKQFAEDGVNLIFGHGNIYGQYFVEISRDYPDVHFVYFNGGYFTDNVTSLNFNTHAMGFFAGLTAGKMSKTKEVGIIAAYEWQQEIEGFYEGVKYLDPSINVHINFMNNWNSNELALEVYEEMKAKNVDVFYPAGDDFSMEVVTQSRKDHIYSIGYLTDHEQTDDSTILTSTIQHVDQLYLYAAKAFNAGTLAGRLLSFDFQDDVISMGKFSNDVPKPIQKEIMTLIDTYKETNLLPNEYD